MPNIDAECCASGLLYMCMDDCRAIKSLIGSLHVPNADMRVRNMTAVVFGGNVLMFCKQDALLNLFFAVLRIKTPTWADAFLDGKRLTGINLSIMI